ncbi:uncharacterized protein LOC131144378 [Malania oleifera]|uniref:uncharacterized protein LOC131144378 n=1 Tax=Malania oleifera TaxID=397392 RepID=UPI0025ADE797|nr:uncharacterized protein LOC131144378 [Malania oleifera]
MSSLSPPILPVEVYPNTVASRPPSSHSSGSFGAVFIVLAVIVVVSAVACCLGRLCNRRFQNPAKQSHAPRPRPGERERPEFNPRPKQKDPEFIFRPKERNQGHPEFAFRPKESDLEFGFERGNPMPGAKQPGNGETKGSRRFENVDFRFDPKHGYEGEFQGRA